MVWTPPQSTHRFNAVGCDIFAGGFTIGMSEHFNVMAHCEESNFAVDTFKRNFPDIPVYISADTSGWPTSFPHHVDVMYGNPPCSSWSGIGRSMFQGADSWKTDPNTDCSRRYLEYGLKMKPTIWADESVPQIQKSGFVEEMASAWMDLGYEFTLVRIDAKFMGLPQQRRRCFMVASKVKVDWRPPEFSGELVPVGDVLERMPGPGVLVEPLPPDHIVALHEVDRRLAETGKEASIADVWTEQNITGRPESEIPRWSNGRVKGRPMFMLHRLRLDAPTSTIAGVYIYIHPYEDRYLTGREAAALCGYPMDYQWAMEHSSGWMLAEVAKAVTPNAGRWLGDQLRRALEAGVPVEEPTYRRATFWSSSGRIVDARMMDHVELRPDPRPAVQSEWGYHMEQDKQGTWGPVANLEPTREVEPTPSGHVHHVQDGEVLPAEWVEQVPS